MKSSAALLLLVAFAATCRSTQGDSPIVALSGDDTRHGVEVLHGNFKASQEVEVRRYHVDTLIQTRFARTVLETEVRNNAIDSRVIRVPFAIPSDAMLVKFEIESDGRKHVGHPVLKDDIQVTTTSSSATIKARNAEAFDVDIGLASGGAVRMRLEYEQLLTRSLERYKNVQQVWPGAVVSDLRVSVRIREATAISDTVKYTLTSGTDSGDVTTLDSPSLVKVSKTSKSQGLSEVRLVLQPSVAEQRDLARQLGLQPEQGVAGQLNVEYDVERYPTAGDIVVRDGHFAHFFAPSDLNDTTALPKYAMFLLDVSGSMAGRKIEQLRDAMKTILGELGPNDLFTVIEFSDSVDVWDLNVPQVGTSICRVYSSQYVPEAQNRASQMKDLGGTSLLEGMQQALRCAMENPKGLEPILLVLTDGQPTSSTSEVVIDFTTTNNMARGYNNLLASIFTLALGDDANLDFLRELALKNGGSFQQVYVASDAAAQLQDFYRAIATPLLTDVSVVFDYQQAEQGSLTSHDFRTYFWGSELVVAGRLLPGQGDKLTGKVTAVGTGGQVVTYPIQVSARPDWQPEKLGGEANAKRLWAFLRTAQLLDQAVVDGVNSAAFNEAIDLALQHSFVTSQTALAVDIVNSFIEDTTTSESDVSTLPPSPTHPRPSTQPPTTPTYRPSLPTMPTTGAPHPTGTSGPTGRPTPPYPTGRPTPPGPPGPPGPTGAPKPRPNPAGAQNVISIESVSIGTLNVAGPLIQFNLG